MDDLERTVRVKVRCQTFACEASVIVPKGGYRNRVLDLLNAESQFLALTDVLLFKDGAESSEDAFSYDVLLVRKGEIVFVEPLNDSW
jgi:hypothetical protein